MAYYKSEGLRGSELEEMINITNEHYIKEGIAVVQKIPTPIKPVEFDKGKGIIKLAFFEQKSTVDYIGVVQGIPICFDAKQTAQTSMPFANIHSHQIDYMEKFEAQKGVSFFVLYFKKVEKYYILPLNKYLEIYENSIKKGKKSISLSDLSEDMEIDIVRGMYINYLHKLNHFL